MLKKHVMRLIRQLAARKIQSSQMRGLQSGPGRFLPEFLRRLFMLLVVFWTNPNRRRRVTHAFAGVQTLEVRLVLSATPEIVSASVIEGGLQKEGGSAEETANLLQNNSTADPTQSVTFHASAQEVLARVEVNEDFQLMYQLVSPDPALGFHIYTTSTGERDALKLLGYRDETYDRPGFAVATGPRSGFEELHRLYNPNNGRHYYTLSDGERDFLVSIGWNFEKDEGFMAPNPVPGMTKISHLYGPGIGDHFFSEQRSQIDAILTQFPEEWVEHHHLGYTLGLPAGDNKVTVTVDKPNANVGDLLKVTVRMDALGLGALIKTDMRLELPEGAALESSTAPTSSTDEYEVTSQYVRWQVLHSDPAAPFNDSSPEADFFVRIGPAAAGRTLQWRAAISSPIPDYNVSNNADVAATVVAPQTINPSQDIGVSFSVNPAQADPSAVVTYTVTVTNSSPTVAPDSYVEIDDIAGVTFVSGGSTNVTHANGKVTVHTGIVPANGGTATDTFTGRLGANLPAGANVRSAARIVTANLNGANDVDTATVIINQPQPQIPDLALTAFTVSPSNADPDSNVVYSVSVQNNSNSLLGPDAYVEIPDSSRLTFVSVGSTDVTHANGVTIIHVGALAPSASFTATFTVQVSADAEGGTTLVSQASIVTANANSGNDSRSVTLTVNTVNQQPTPPHLTLNVVGNAIAAPGDVYALIYTIGNSGGTLAQNVLLTFTYDTRVSYITSDKSDVSVNQDTRTVTFDPFFVGANNGDILSRETDFRINVGAIGNSVFSFTLTSSNATTVTFEKVVSI